MRNFSFRFGTYNVDRFGFQKRKGFFGGHAEKAAAELCTWDTGQRTVGFRHICRHPPTWYPLFRRKLATTYRLVYAILWQGLPAVRIRYSGTFFGRDFCCARVCALRAFDPKKMWSFFYTTQRTIWLKSGEYYPPRYLMPPEV
jgi:hypothetical protein